LIDSTIIRTLKQSYVQQKDSYGAKSTEVVPSDELVTAVQTAVRDRFEVTATDVSRRVESLVHSAVISKVALDSTSFRSVGYQYLAEDVDTTHPVVSPTNSFGTELFDVLCKTLEFPSIDHHKLTLPVFEKLTLKWLSKTPVAFTGPCTIAHALSVVTRRLHDLLKQQLRALVHQHGYGISVSADELRLPSRPEPAEAIHESTEAFITGLSEEIFNFLAPEAKGAIFHQFKVLTNEAGEEDTENEEKKEPLLSEPEPSQTG
jgi:hypothetical protein